MQEYTIRRMFGRDSLSFPPFQFDGEWLNEHHYDDRADNDHDKPPYQHGQQTVALIDLRVYLLCYRLIVS
jgi:hypothetical protein